MKKTTWIVVVVLIIIVIVLAYFAFLKKSSDSSAPVQTTPVTTNSGSSTSSTSKPYDGALTTTYITSQGIWPPAVSFPAGEFACTPGGTATSVNGVIAQKTINGKIYCVTTQSEGAAGSTYTTYTYKTKDETHLAITTFVLRYVDCGNYSGSQESACMAERASFNPDIVADALIVHAEAQN